MLKEFKDFLFKGNLIELAVALVMGLAIVALVNALVAALVMPVIGMIIGKPSLTTFISRLTSPYSNTALSSPL